MFRRAGLRQARLRQIGDTSGTGQALSDLGIKSLLSSQAGAVCGFGFDSFTIHAIHGSEGVSSPGFVGLTQSQLLTGPTGRSGLGKVSYVMSGAGGVAAFRASVPFGLATALTAFWANAAVDHWYMSVRAAIPATSNAGEIALGAVSVAGNLNATDAGSNPYVYFGVTGSTSTSHLVIKALDNALTSKVTDTGFTFEQTVGGWHEYTFFHFAGTLYVQVDFVTVFSTPFGQIFNNFSDLANAVPIYFFRTTSAASQTCLYDRMYAAGPQ